MKIFCMLIVSFNLLLCSACTGDPRQGGLFWSPQAAQKMQDEKRRGIEQREKKLLGEKGSNESLRAEERAREKSIAALRAKGAKMQQDIDRLKADADAHRISKEEVSREAQRLLREKNALEAQYNAAMRHHDDTQPVRYYNDTQPVRHNDDRPFITKEHNDILSSLESI